MTRFSSGDPYESAPNAASSSREYVSPSSSVNARMISRSVSSVRIRDRAARSATRALRGLAGGRRLSLGRRLRRAFGLGFRLGLHVLGKLLVPGAAIPSFVDLGRDLALHQELRELATLRLTLDRHSDSRRGFSRP